MNAERFSPTPAALLFLSGLLIGAVPPGARAQDITTISGSPLTIHVGEDASFQVLNSNVLGTGQFYPPSTTDLADMGVLLRSGGTLHSPDFYSHGFGSATSSLGATSVFGTTDVGSVTGIGTSSNPYQVVVSADATSAQIHLTMVVSYVNGDEFFTKQMTFRNDASTNVTFDAFVASDIFLAADDDGLPYHDGSSGSVGGKDCDSGGYHVVHIPLTPADHYTARYFGSVWQEIGDGDLTDTVETGCIDNGAALEWKSVSLAPNESTTISCRTSFGDAPDPTCVEAPAGMVAWFPFDESTGTKPHNFIDGVQAAYGLTTPYYPQPTSGFVDGALRFVEPTDHAAFPRGSAVVVADAPALDPGTGDFAIDTWIKVEDQPVGPGPSVIVEKGLVPNTVCGTLEKGYILFLSADGSSHVRLGLIISDKSTAGASEYHSAVPIALDQWTLIAVNVIRNSRIEFWIDGILTDVFLLDSTLTEDLSNPHPMMIGNSVRCHSPLIVHFGLRGLLDELEIFDRALDPAEIEALYAAGAAGKCKSDCNGNGIHDPIDVATGSSDDSNGNGYPDECEPIVGSTVSVSVAAGGAQVIEYHAGPARAGRPYLLLGSMSGAKPGQVAGGHVIPLEPDPYYFLTVQGIVGRPPFGAGAKGTLDGAGTARVRLTVPQGMNPALIGTTLHHAFVVFESGAGRNVIATSPPVSLELTP